MNKIIRQVKVRTKVIDRRYTKEGEGLKSRLLVGGMFIAFMWWLIWGMSMMAQAMR